MQKKRERRASEEKSRETRDFRPGGFEDGELVYMGYYLLPT